MKKNLYYLCLAALLASFASCSDNADMTEDIQSNFTSFKIKGY